MRYDLPRMPPKNDAAVFYAAASILVALAALAVLVAIGRL